MIMERATKVFICDLIQEEARKALDLEGLEDVEVIAYEADFEDAQRGLGDLKAKLERHARPGDVVCIFGSEWVLSPAGLERLAPGHSFVLVGSCFELVAGPGLIEAVLSKGAYVVVPGTLRRWREMVQAHGMGEEESRFAFSDTMSEIVLMDTGKGDAMRQELKDFADFVGKPCSIVPVGLDFLRLKLSSAVLGARLEREVERANEEGRMQAKVRSDYAMAFDLLERMSQGTEEESVVGSILDILHMLFSPAEIDYYSLRPTGEVLVFDYTRGTFDHTSGLRAASLLEKVNDWDEASNGFKLKVENAGKELGVAILRRIEFPEYRREYLSLASQLSVVFGLAVTNARAFKSLKDSEEQVERAFALESTMLSISQGFFGRQDFDRTVNDALARVGEAVGSSRVVLLQFSKDMRAFSCTHEWVAPGVSSAMEALTNVPVAAQSWLMERVQTEGTVRVVSLSSASEDVRDQLAPFEKAQVKAMALAAVIVEGHHQGMACLQHVDEKSSWDSDETSMLIFLAQTLSVALQRRKNQEDMALLAESVTMSNKVLRHDIRNELMVLTGSMQLYDMKKEERHLERASRSVARLTEILDHFKELDNFLRSSQSLFAVDLREAIGKAMALHQMPFEVNGNGQIQADYAFSSVLDNLVRNAKRHGDAKRMSFRIARVGGFLELTVADDGTGIPQEARARLFQEGFSYGEKRSTGLGLFWIRKTMERYGGWVQLVDSEKGATFVLGFPMN